jgi:hypothetical protein
VSSLAAPAAAPRHRRARKPGDRLVH